MANISSLLNTIKTSIYGRDMRSALHDSIKAVNDDVNKLSEKVNYIEPQITSFTMSPSTTQYEDGTSKTANSITFRWELNKSVTSVTFDGQSLSASARSAKNSSAVSDTKTFTLTVSDGKNTAKSFIKISFLPKVYYGVSSNENLTASDEINKLSGILTDSRAGKYTMTAGIGQYCYLCLPYSYGTPKVKIGGYDTDMHFVEMVSHTNESNKTQNYNVYRTKNTNLGEVTMIVS